MNHSSRVVWCGQPFCPFDAYGFSDTSNWSLYACHREMCGSPEFQGCMWLTPAYALAVLEKILCWCCPISNPYIKKYIFLITFFSEWYCRGVGDGERWLGFYNELGCPFSRGFLEERKSQVVYFVKAQWTEAFRTCTENLFYWQLYCWNYFVLKLCCTSPLPTLKIPHKWSDEIYFLNYY